MAPFSPKRYRTILAIALLLLLAAPATYGQAFKHKMADRYQAQFDYPHMATVYEDIVKGDKAVPADFRKLAFAYKKMGDVAKAADTYKRLIDKGKPAPDDILAYANLLRDMGRYDEAMANYKVYAVQAPDDQWVKDYLKNPDLFLDLKRDSTLNSVRTLPINSSDADLGPAVMQDLLIFSSARGEGAGGRTKYKWDREPYLNLYSALLKGETATDPVVMRKVVNSRFHDGTASFDSTRQRLYFTRDNFFRGKLIKASDGEVKLGIYYTDITKGEFGQPQWGDLIPFEQGDPEYNYGQPCISPDGKRLYFVSDRQGGSGGTDIWYCDDLNGQWGVPKNMGPKVNTPGCEMTPFITADSVLYFSSTGHPGLGGYDLFSVRLKPDGPGRVFNLGYPVNTSHNDRGLILLKDDSTGFFVSDRPGGHGSDDIYGCTVHPPLMHLTGKVVDKLAQTPIEGYTLDVRDAKGDFIDAAKIKQLPGGLFTIELPYSERYTVSAVHEGYRQGKVVVDADTDDLDNVTLQLEKYDYGAEGTVVHGETGAPMDSAVVELCDARDSVLQSLVTNGDGTYQFPLRADTDYRIKVHRDGFFKQSARLTTKGKANAIIHTDFKLFPLKVNQVVRLENIYYDLAKWNIRPDAAVELGKLVQTLLDNPTVKIELSSHTDCRGGNAYNMRLSQKRAKSAVDYLIKNGIAKDRLVAKGYGETRPVAKCDCPKCTEAEYQANRRTEFKVLAK